MTLRCVLDGLLLPAVVHGRQRPTLTAWDGDEPFPVEAVEAMYYEMVTATRQEIMQLEAGHYRLLKRAEDFQLLNR